MIEMSIIIPITIVNDTTALTARNQAAKPNSR